MSIPKIDYIRPKTIGEACHLLQQYQSKAKILAGGTDLLTRLKKREITPEILIDLKGIPELNKILLSNDESLIIGALTTIQTLEDSALIKERYGVLHQAATQLGSTQVRHMGTIGGNLCNAAPSAETAPALIGIGAKARILGASGEKIVWVEDFFTGPGKAILNENEFLVDLELPKLPPRTSGVYLKHTLRRAMDIAMVGIAVVMSLNSKRSISKEVRIVMGAVAPTPMRAKEAETYVQGKSMSTPLAEEAAEIASKEAKPISDLRASEEYRREMIKVLTSDALQKSWEIATALP